MKSLQHNIQILVRCVWIISILEISVSNAWMQTFSSLPLPAGPYQTIIGKSYRSPRANASTRLMMEDEGKEDNDGDDDNDDDEFTFEVLYEGRKCQVPIRKGESILAAMERCSDVSNKLTIQIPSDCRRGNCMTCSGRHIESSEEDEETEGSCKSSLKRGEDGLAPYISKELNKRGYILLCSSYVVGDGLKLELGSNDEAWDDMYRRRIEDESTQLAGRAAMAKTITMNSEKFPQRWAKETEETLEKTKEQ